MPHLGPMELLILLGILMLIFGSTRIPKLARSLGEARRELQKAEDGSTTAD
jgi:sec-independent protein translocase protein TatA